MAAEKHVRGDSEFTQLPDGTWQERDLKTGWIGTSRFQHGLVTGRPSPQTPRRERAITSVMRSHPDLVAETDIAGPGHGQLFDVAPLTRSKEEVMRENEAPPRRLSSGEGFLPRLGLVAGETDPEKRAAIAEDKAEVIRQAGRAVRPVVGMSMSGVQLGDPGTSTPMRQMMENRSKFFNDSTEGDWYFDESSQVDERAGNQKVSYGTMRRATAHTSPRTFWDQGHPQDGSVTYPNLDAAEAVVEGVEHQRHLYETDPDHAKAYGEFDPVIAAMNAPGYSKDGKVKQPTTKERARNVGESMREGASPADPIVTSFERNKVRTMAGEKVPNFDLALERGSLSKAVRREAAQAYTSDAFDSMSAGYADYAHIGDGGLTTDKGIVPAGARGQYDLVAMTGRRAGLKMGMTPSEAQQHIWRNARAAAQAKQQLFVHKQGVEITNSKAKPPRVRTINPNFDNQPGSGTSKIR